MFRSVVTARASARPGQSRPSVKKPNSQICEFNFVGCQIVHRPQETPSLSAAESFLVITVNPIKRLLRKTGVVSSFYECGYRKQEDIPLELATVLIR